jgi:iron-sulfur cluster protein
MLRERVRRTKEQSISNLDALLQEFVTNAKKRGARIFLANDGPMAINYIAKIAKANNAKLITKSKSLTSEEIEMNHPLEEMGYEVVETDLGERIVQIAKEKPIHLVFPAAHKTVDQIAELFSSDKSKVNPDHSAIMKFVRENLRKIFLSADIGVTGANIAIAETGTIVIETNEGNARLVSSIPKIQVVIMGMEKIVPTIESAIDIIKAHPTSATGQQLTTYVSFISGRSPLNQQKDRELHIIILDNGRTAMRDDLDGREALYCIRCGACMNACPTYEVVGGHVFGYIYPGPIGIPWTEGVHGLRHANFAALCIACGLCHEMCPVDIDIPYLIAKVKEQQNAVRGQSFVTKVMIRADEFTKTASTLAPISNWIVKQPSFRYLLEKALGIDRRRILPKFSRHTFDAWWGEHISTVEESQRKVAYFVDVYANYNRPDIGIGAVTLLERCGVKVVVPEQKTSGMPYFSYGELEKARAVAKYNVEHMLPFVRKGYCVVATEPTATYCFKELYPRLLMNDESRLVAEHTNEFLDYLSKIESFETYVKKIFSGKAGFHISCHQRSLGKGAATLGLLRKTGLEVKLIETGTCCGMGGTFGLKAGVLGYELSSEVGLPLFEMFKKGGIEFGLTESSVCTLQLEQGTGLLFDHPVAVLSAALEGRSEYVDHLRAMQYSV